MAAHSGDNITLENGIQMQQPRAGIILSSTDKGDAIVSATSTAAPPPGGYDAQREQQFPWMLHRLLDDKTVHHILSWRPDGKSFQVQDKSQFERVVLLERKYFKQTKFKSFARQLNLWGFVTKKAGQERGCYHHELFIRGSVNLCYNMKRIKIKGTGAQSQAANGNIFDRISASTQQSEERILPMMLSDLYANGDQQYYHEHHAAQHQNTAQVPVQPRQQYLGNETIQFVHHQHEAQPVSITSTAAVGYAPPQFSGFQPPPSSWGLREQHIAAFSALPWANQVAPLIHHDHQQTMEETTTQLSYPRSTTTPPPPPSCHMTLQPQAIQSSPLTHDTPERETQVEPASSVKFVNGRMELNGVPLIPLRPNKPKEVVLSYPESQALSPEPLETDTLPSKSTPITEHHQNHQNHPIQVHISEISASVPHAVSNEASTEIIHCDHRCGVNSEGRELEQQQQPLGRSQSSSSLVSATTSSIEHQQQYLAFEPPGSREWAGVNFLEF